MSSDVRVNLISTILCDIGIVFNVRVWTVSNTSNALTSVIEGKAGHCNDIEIGERKTNENKEKNKEVAIRG